MNKRTTSAFMAVVMLVLSLAFAGAMPVSAASKSREKAWRIGTYVGSAATIYALARGKGTLALIGGGATLLSYSQWKKEARNRRRSEADYRAYRTRWLRAHRGKRVIRR